MPVAVAVEGVMDVIELNWLMGKLEMGSGRYGGTYAHTDIAFRFASWISPEFKLYIIKDYQRLKKDEANRLAIGWDAKRELSKINYRNHTDAVKEILITPSTENNY